MPVVRSIYSGVKQIAETVFAQSDRSFEKACLIEYPRKGIWAIGFISTDAKGEVKHKVKTKSGDLLSVFVPTTPNPTSGFMLFFPRSDVIELEMSYKRIIPNDDEPCSYINFYIANSAVILPIFGDEKADQNALEIVKSSFPDRKVVTLDGSHILLGGGGVHCITQQQPRSKM